MREDVINNHPIHADYVQFYEHNHSEPRKLYLSPEVADLAREKLRTGVKLVNGTKA